MTNERFANWLGVAPRTVSYWRSRPQSVLESSNQELLDAAYERLAAPARDRFTQLVADYLTAAAQTTGGPSAALVLADGYPRPLTSDIAAMRSFRAADQKVGGGHLYATVVNYLHTEVAPRLFGATGDADARSLYTAAAGLTEMAGWMAHDAGRDSVARQHFGRALDLVKVGGDRQLAAHVHASMSHLAHHLGQPDKAIEHAAAGQAVLEGAPRQPELVARLLAMQARGLAAAGHLDDTNQLLRRAETALGWAADEPPSQWVSGFDEGALASEAARCMRIVGDLSEAERQAQRIIVLRPSDRTRSRAIGQILLAGILVARRRPDEACTVARQVLDSTKSLSSGFVISQLLELRRALEPHQDNPTVAEFLGCLDSELQEREWLYAWMSRDKDGARS